jgi:hypothetical protein
MATDAFGHMRPHVRLPYCSALASFLRAIGLCGTMLAVASPSCKRCASARSATPARGRAFHDCLVAARAHHVPVILVRKGMHYATGDGVTFDALAPEEPLLAEGRNDVNENSVVLMMTFRRAGATPFRMLLTGDAGAQTEARVLASGVDVRADIRHPQSRASRVGVLVDAGVRRRGSCSLRADQRRTAQPLRAPRADDVNHTAATRHNGLSNRSLRSRLGRGWGRDYDNAAAWLPLARHDRRTFATARSSARTSCVQGPRKDSSRCSRR